MPLEGGSVFISNAMMQCFLSPGPPIAAVKQLSPKVTLNQSFSFLGGDDGR